VDPDAAVSDLFAAVLLVPAGAYGAGVVALHRRGDHWPPSRAAAFAAGLVVLAVGFVPPVGTHDGDFRFHVLQHLLIAMVAPLLLAVSAPVTLALRVTPRAVRTRLLRVLHSRAVTALTRPAVVLVAEVGSLYALYLTPLYAETEAHLWVHVLVHLHMILTGCLFSWAVAGRDPMPHRASTRGRLLLLFLAAGSHDLLAKLMYAHDRPHGAGPVADVQFGAQLMYYGGDAVEVALAVAVLTSWYAHGGRELRRAARRAAPAPAPPPGSALTVGGRRGHGAAGPVGGARGESGRAGGRGPRRRRPRAGCTGGGPGTTGGPGRRPAGAAGGPGHRDPARRDRTELTYPGADGGDRRSVGWSSTGLNAPVPDRREFARCFPAA